MQKRHLTGGLCAVTLSLSLLAGCASPTSPVTPPTGPTSDAPVTPAGPTQPGAPAQPSAPATVAPQTFTGVATFRGQPLAGYTVKVLAASGEPVAVVADLAGASGLAVVQRESKTDAQGRFSFDAVGLGAGHALRIQIQGASSTLETVVTADHQSLADGQRYLLQANDLNVNETTTALAKYLRGVLRAVRVLKAEDAAQVLAKAAREVNKLTAKIDEALKKDPELSNRLVANGSESAEASAMRTLSTVAGQAQTATQTIATLIADVAAAAKRGTSDAAADAAVKDALKSITFLGTALKAAVNGATITLTNADTGKSVDAGGNLGEVTGGNASSGGSSGSSVQLVTGDAALAFLAPENFNTHSGADYKGLNVGFRLGSLDIADISKIEVSLYAGSKLLATNTAIMSEMAKLPAGTKQLSTPFILKHGNYSETHWTLGQTDWFESPVPTKAVVKVTKVGGRVAYVVENTSLSQATAAYASVVPSLYDEQDAETPNFLVAENFNTHDDTDYTGVNVGFRFGDNLAIADVEDIVVRLYDADNKLLATNTGVMSQFATLDADTKQFSAPFFTRPGTYGPETFWTLDDEPLKVAPARAQIEVTSKEGDVYVVENKTLSGPAFKAPRAHDLFLAAKYVVAENFNTHSGTDYQGLNLGFRLTSSLRVADLESLTVELYDGGTLLQTNTATLSANVWKALATADEKQLSTPFFAATNTGGYVEEYWTFASAKPLNASVEPDNAKIVIKDRFGNSYTVVKTGLTGDYSALFD